MKQKVFQLLNEIEPVATAHNNGEKFVFLSPHDTQTQLTQFAYGKLMPGDVVEQHRHATMEECFYFIEGTGKYFIDSNEYELKPQTFIRIPANTLHSLSATGKVPLVFVYFGIATTG